MRDSEIAKALQVVLGLVGGSALTFMSQVLFARTLSPSDYGLLTGALALGIGLAPFAGFGLQFFWLQAFGNEGLAARRWIRPAFIQLGFTVGLVASIYYALLYVAFSNSNMVDVAPLFVPVLIVQVLMLLSVVKFQLEERYLLVAAMHSLIPSVRFFVAVLALVLGYSLASIGNLLFYLLVFCGVYFTIVLVSLSAGHVKLALRPAANAPNSDPKPATVFTMLNFGWPIALSEGTALLVAQATVYFQIVLNNAEAAGIYSVSYTLIVAALIPVTSFLYKYLLGKLYYWNMHDPEMFAKYIRISNVLVFLSGVAIAVVLQLIAGFLIPLFFGSEYKASIEILRWMTLYLPLWYATLNLGLILLVKGIFKARLYCISAYAATALIANFTLVPLFGIMGTVISTAASLVVLTLVYIVALRFHVLRNAGIGAWIASPKEITGWLRSELFRSEKRST